NPTADNLVNTVAVNGSTVYVGGSFGHAGGQTRAGIAALDATTGLATAWNPTAVHATFVPQVNTIVVNGGLVYAGGPFQGIGGQTRAGIAALDPTTGLATSWDPGGLNSVVEEILPVGGTVYVGGSFGTTMGGQIRNGIAAVDATTGLATAWDPECDGFVYSLGIDGSTVYAGGIFTSIGGQSRNALAALDASTGLADSWNPQAGGPQFSGIVLDLELAGSNVYAGGYFKTMGGLPQASIAAIGQIATAISLVATEARVEAGRVHLEWYASEDPVLASVYRRTDATNWALMANPVSSQGRIVYEDTDVLPGMRYGYRLVVRDALGEEQSSESWVDVPAAGAPRAVALESARPNPFFERVAMRFGVPATGRVRLSVYDLQGRKVADIVDRTESAGWRDVEWNGQDDQGRAVASGTYFARLESGGAVETRKIILAR
ncbi:MAG TPA: T9SS type A sorting domain-containing protein, partial [Candidatus Saccharimonadales bacterium]|nr:T9SS type A sorting domain-containing protein [Candidatus Saccharimonadales bacterium]